ncbi:nuclear transport factor 2 family protein [Zobellia uliginosa]|uniref:nuclear transport factor 2 family protein n=1 Tax=Zobellia uliginosa TaxID=143224 RepID=UPI0026E49379|nr:nuclear transport factor 2 family protein [Zobellia uliginosa]MDO6517222.1 nuclear transport factor 2 family protein [Zobellia uliginosa]
MKPSVVITLILLLSGFSDVTAQPVIEASLKETITQLDRTYFEAYNSCNMEKQAEMYAEDIEFYHDKGGLTTSKQDLLDSLKKNICGKVTRELVEGSIEVFPISEYGAVEIGFHKFHNNEEPDAISEPGKFIIIWKKTEATWNITRVISLH